MNEKIGLAFEFINILYDKNLITDAYIVGSIAEGCATEQSDIDIYIVNPGFVVCPYLGRPDERVRDDEKDERMLGEELLKMGVEWIKVEICNGGYFYHQIYNGQAFHLMTYPDISDLDKKYDNIRITKKD